MTSKRIQVGDAIVQYAPEYGCWDVRPTDVRFPCISFNVDSNGRIAWNLYYSTERRGMYLIRADREVAAGAAIFIPCPYDEATELAKAFGADLTQFGPDISRINQA